MIFVIANHTFIVIRQRVFLLLLMWIQTLHLLDIILIYFLIKEAYFLLIDDLIFEHVNLIEVLTFVAKLIRGFLNFDGFRVLFQGFFVLINSAAFTVFILNFKKFVYFLKWLCSYLIQTINQQPNWFINNYFNSNSKKWARTNVCFKKQDKINMLFIF